MFIYLRNVALGLVLLSCSSVPKKADSASLEAVCSEIIDRAIDFRDPNREDKLAGCQAYVEFQAYKSQAARSLLNLNVLYSSFISKDLRSVAVAKASPNWAIQYHAADANPCDLPLVRVK